MSDEENVGAGQPIGQVSPDGRWRWDGHNWVPVQQLLPPPYLQPKKGLPTWAKVLLILLSLVVALLVLLTVVGLLVDKSYADWSCEDVAAEAVRISADKDAALVLTDVSDLVIVEDHREDFSAPDTGRGVILSCQGTGSWDDAEDTPVTVELAAGADGDEWVRYEMNG